MLATESPFPQYFDLDGTPLNNGSLYFGVANQNPETNPITVYWDSAGTQPAAQPIQTINGYTVRNGTPSSIFVNGDYSLNVRNGRGNLVFYAATSKNPVLEGNVTRTVDAITAVDATGLPDGAVIIARGRSTVSDGGGGIFRYVSGSSQATDGGTVFAPTAGGGRLFRNGWTSAGFDGPVDAKWFGAVGGADVGAAINSAVAAGFKKIQASGAYSLSTQILLSSISDVQLDLRGATITAAAALNVSLIRFLNCNRCSIFPGVVDGNAAGQTSSSFGIDLNGGSHNTVFGGRFTNCKTYGVYNIGSNYANIENVVADANQQAGIAGDVGSSDVVGVRIKNCVTFGNGLSGVGALSGVHIEGNNGFGFYYKELDVDGLISYSNRGSGITMQNVRGYSLSHVEARVNYRQGITLASCLYGTGGDFVLEANNIGAVAGYENALAVDDSGVLPASTNNMFFGISGRGHPGFTVIERGTANNNTFMGVDSISDSGVVSLGGANSIAMNRGSVYGAVNFRGQLTGNTTSSGIGYSAGSGGSVSQATDKSTGVTLNAPNGRITMNAAALAANTTVTFTLTNSSIGSADALVLSYPSGATPGAYILNSRPANGSAVIEVRNITAGSLSEAVVIDFKVVKGAVS